MSFRFVGSVFHALGVKFSNHPPRGIRLPEAMHQLDLLPGDTTANCKSGILPKDSPLLLRVGVLCGGEEKKRLSSLQKLENFTLILFIVFLSLAHSPHIPFDRMI